MKTQNGTVRARGRARLIPVIPAILVYLVAGAHFALADVPSAGREVLLRSPDWSLVAGTAQLPELHARAAVLIESETGTVLAAKNPHLVLPAASLTKVVSIHAVMVAARTGELELETSLRPPPESWAVNQPAGSSLMFLGPGQVLSAWELLQGLAISSGNDAALALALFADGGVPAFAARMNAAVRRAGLVTTEFVEPSGLSPFNLTTAYEYAAFLRLHLRDFPELLESLYSAPSYTYPQGANMLTPEAGPSITQYNRNLLIGRYEGADGVKTGFIDESGYHLAATAQRDGRRLIAVVMGVDASSHREGGMLRAEDAEVMLDFGFREFELLRFSPPAGDVVRAYRSRGGTVVPQMPSTLAVSVPAGASSRLQGHTEQISEVIAPVPAGARIGTVAVTVDGVTLVEAPITLPEVPRGGLFRRLWDSLVLFFSSLFGGDSPVAGDELELVAN